MALPINIEQLIQGKLIEWARIEFKKGWNPQAIIHTLCAFANDIDNWGGGYIVLGVEEKKGKALLPPIGLSESLDKIQKEILQLCHLITPHYFPIIQPYTIDGKDIIILWCPAGDYRPYSAPKSLQEKSQREYYIRKGASTITAKNNNGTLQQIFAVASKIPFDDRINRQASIQDFDIATIQAFLHEVDSDLYEESKLISLEELCRSLHIAKGVPEDIRPVNVGLLFFSKNPEAFFPRTRIEIVWHKDNLGDNFTEHYFDGPIHYQLRNALSFIKANIIGERVAKIPNIAEAERHYNFPYAALEEALANAVYHKNYEIQEPIEVQIWNDKIEILSFPGPPPPIDKKTIENKERIIARIYRNRRVGDFLKELRLTEGRGTGFPKIYRAMRQNRSPHPLFETNDNLSYLLVTIPVNEAYFLQESNQASNQDTPHTNNTLAKNKITSGNQAGNQAEILRQYSLEESFHPKILTILAFTNEAHSKEEILSTIGVSNQSKNRTKYIDPLIDQGWIRMTIPDKPSSPNQKYIITESGRLIISSKK